jgi:NAD(P)-dependent dehydrogenase (short-subunit alcohol dehydrogenase family)
MTADGELNGRRALVTGGTKGVGETVVTALRDAGASVLTTARSRPERLTQPDFFIAADVSTPEGCEAVARAVRERLGGVNAGHIAITSHLSQPACLTARAAVSITRATARGWEMCMKWLPLRTVTFDPARSAILRAIAGSSSRSSVAMTT